MIDTALYITLMGFAFSSAFTPGPNNFMLMSSGALFGFRRTIPHILGVAIGFNIVLIAAILGMQAIVDQFPLLLTVVKTAGAAWLGWMGIKFFIAAAKHKDTTGKSKSGKSKSGKAKVEKRSRPFHFYEAVLFQWINPKALIMALAAVSGYVGISDSLKLRSFLICGTFLFMGLASAATWTIAGSTLNRLMSQGRSAIILNVIMGLLLIATAIIILLAHT